MDFLPIFWRMRRIKIREGFPGQRLVVIPSRIVSHALESSICRLLLPTRIGRFNQAKYHFVERRHGVKEYILIVCLAGSGNCRLGFQDWRLEEGHAIVLPPDLYHRYESDQERPWTIFWVHFVGSAAPAYMEAIGVTISEPRFWIGELAVVTDAFEETYRYVLSGYSDKDLFALSTSFARLLGLCRIHQKSALPRRRMAEDRVLRAIRYMRENVRRPLSLGDCARSAGWSSAHFSMAFRRQTNLSPIQFFTRLKMSHACELLKTTDLSMQEVAASIGFNDQFYFSRLFHRHLRMSPTAYRRDYSLRL
jgi:AraC family transcriptional regulator, arabinose operon regulatory protein